MYEKYFEQLKEECLIRNRSSRTTEAYISNIASFMKMLYVKKKCLILMHGKKHVYFRICNTGQNINVLFSDMLIE